MPKRKTSAKRGVSSNGKPQARKYIVGQDVSVGGLKEAIMEALFEADYDTFKGCIAILLEKRDYREIIKATGLSKSTLYRMCEPGSNPTLENIGSVLQYINQLETRVAV